MQGRSLQLTQEDRKCCPGAVLGFPHQLPHPKGKHTLPSFPLLLLMRQREGLGFHFSPPCSSEADLISNEPPGCGPHCHLLDKEERGFVPQSDFTISPIPQTHHLCLGMATLLYGDMSSYLKWKSELSLQVFNVMIQVKFPARYRVHLKSPTNTGSFPTFSQWH